MTIPWQHNCPHRDDAICVSCSTKFGNDFIARITELEQRIKVLTEERDLAIAHDRQPYPTADAYAKACTALENKRQQIEARDERIAGLEAVIEQAKLHLFAMSIYSSPNRAWEATKNAKVILDSTPIIALRKVRAKFGEFLIHKTQSLASDHVISATQATEDGQSDDARQFDSWASQLQEFASIVADAIERGEGEG